MAVIWCEEIWRGRRGSIDDHAIREYVRVFRVQTDDAHDGPLTVMGYSIIPQLLDSYSDANGTVVDVDAIVRKITPQQDAEDPFFWDIVVDYSSAPFDIQQANHIQENPLLRPPILAWDFAQYQVVAKYDNGLAAGTSTNPKPQPVANSAKMLYDPPAMIDDFRPVLTITRNEVAVDPVNLIAYNNCVNSDTIWGISPRQAKLNIRAQRVYENNLVYWTVTYVIQFNKNTWDLKLLDQGKFQLSVDGKSTQRIYGADGRPVADPVPLNGVGYVLDLSFPVQYVTYRMYNELPFAALNLPTVIS